MDDCKDFCNILNGYLSNQRDIIVIGLANDGLELLKLIKIKRPDLILLDIIMPHHDGLGVLERLSKMNIDPRPLIIISSAINEDILRIVKNKKFRTIFKVTSRMLMSLFCLVS